MTETEVKIWWPGERGDPRTNIERLGYAEVSPRTLESDQLFDRGPGELRNGDRILRLRQAAGEAMVTYKGPAERERYKSREEIEFTVSDAMRFQLVLERLGFIPGFRYEKFRTTFAANGEAGKVTLDETPIGVYLELEGPESWIDATAKRLGFTDSEYITASYAALYRNYRLGDAEAPEDMVF
jgi:adenylate cyclase, class 2